MASPTLQPAVGEVGTGMSNNAGPGAQRLDLGKLADASIEEFVKSTASEAGKQLVSEGVKVLQRNGSLAVSAGLGLASGGLLPAVLMGADVAATAANLGVTIRVLQKVNALGSDVSDIKAGVEGVHFALEAKDEENKERFRAVLRSQAVTQEQLRAAEIRGRRREEREERRDRREEERHLRFLASEQSNHQHTQDLLGTIGNRQQRDHAELTTSSAEVKSHVNRLAAQIDTNQKQVLDQHQLTQTVLRADQATIQRRAGDLQQVVRQVQESTQDSFCILEDKQDELLVGQEEAKLLVEELQERLKGALADIPGVLEESALRAERRAKEEDLTLLLSYYQRCLAAVQSGEKPPEHDVASASDYASKLEAWAWKHLSNNRFAVGHPRRLDWLVLYAFAVRAEAEVRQLRRWPSTEPDPVGTEFLARARGRVEQEAIAVVAKHASSWYQFACQAAPLLAQYAVLRQQLASSSNSSGASAGGLQWEDGLDSLRRIFLRTEGPGPTHQQVFYGATLELTADEASFLRGPSKEVHNVLEEEVLVSDILAWLGAPEEELQKLSKADLGSLRVFLRRDKASRIQTTLAETLQRSFGFEPDLRRLTAPPEAKGLSSAAPTLVLPSPHGPLDPRFSPGPSLRSSAEWSPQTTAALSPVDHARQASSASTVVRESENDVGPFGQDLGPQLVDAFGGATVREDSFEQADPRHLHAELNTFWNGPNLHFPSAESEGLSPDAPVLDEVIPTPKGSPGQVMHGPSYDGSVFLTGHPSTCHQLLTMQTDILDNMPVLKVVLPRPNLHALCNALKPGSSEMDGLRVKFDAFEQRESFQTVGLFGNKCTIQSFLNQHQLLKPDRVAALLPGLYCCWDNRFARILYVFFWHQERDLHDLVKDPEMVKHSGNVLRYLTELCQHVYVCTEEASIEAVDQGLLNHSTKARTMKAAFEKQHAGKNSLGAEPAVNYDVSIVRNSWYTRETVFKPSAPEQAKLVTGASRFGLLESTALPAHKTSKKQAFSCQFPGLREQVWELRLLYEVRMSRDTEEFLTKQGVDFAIPVPSKPEFSKVFRITEHSVMKPHFKQQPHSVLLSGLVEQTLPARRAWGFRDFAVPKPASGTGAMPLTRPSLSERPFRPIVELPADKEVDLIFLYPGAESGAAASRQRDNTPQALLVVRETRAAPYEMAVYGLDGTLRLPEGVQPLWTFRRGPYKLFAFDQESGIFAAYKAAEDGIVVVHFSERFHRAKEGKKVELPDDVSDLQWIEISSEVPNLITGSRQMFLMDSQCVIRSVRLRGPEYSPTMDHGRVVLEGESAVFVPPGGGSVLALGAEDVGEAGATFTMYSTQMKEAPLCPPLHLPGLSLPSPLPQRQCGLVTLDGQLMLVVLCAPSSRNSHLVQMQRLKYTSANEKRGRNVTIERPGSLGGDRDLTSLCPELGFVVRVFERYPTVSRLEEEDLENASERKMHLRFVLQDQFRPTSAKAKVLAELKKVIDGLVKPMGRLTVSQEVVFEAEFLAKSKGALLRPPSPVALGTWLRNLACLVPLQIARAERKNLVPLNEGLQLDVDSRDGSWTVQSYCEHVFWGSYESVLNSWTGDVVVVSSMGRQSSGKSFLLNHLFGCLFDVAGHRCTDGVWLSLRQISGTLYVALDFEGQGSQARFEQEDMLLSWVNAAISTVTIFNKMGPSFDKDTLRTFSHFEQGVHLALNDTGSSKDSKLFSGRFLVAFKDVSAGSAHEVKQGLQNELECMGREEHNNWIGLMFQEEILLQLLPSFETREYYGEQGLGLIARDVRNATAVYRSGREFMNDLKLVLGRAAVGDWDKMDRHRCKMRVKWLQTHLDGALTFGQVDSMDDDVALPEAQVEVLLDGQAGEKMILRLPDTGLNLSGDELLGTKPLPAVVCILEEEKVCQKRTIGEPAWFEQLKGLMVALLQRREQRVCAWIEAATQAFTEEDVVKQLPILGDLVQSVRVEMDVKFQELRDRWTFCGSKCDECFQHCLRPTGHSPEQTHHCGTDHQCVEQCGACAAGGKALQCSQEAEHKGQHDCRQIQHNCMGDCRLKGLAAGCQSSCARPLNHPGECECSGEHLCPEQCSLPGCSLPCLAKYGAKHDKHMCNSDRCIQGCSVSGCSRKCADPDHFHSTVADALHICELTHRCLEVCEERGNCDVLTSLKAVEATFHGRRSRFSYDQLAEQNSRRLPCCKVIPVGCVRHDGPHAHSDDPETVHKCEERCPGCGYYCHLPVGHEKKHPLHRTTHGNMRRAVISGEEDTVIIKEHELEGGDAGEFLFCHVFCKVLGRGHIHLIPCGKATGGRCLQGAVTGARHETHSYGPDREVPKDELTHDAYWKLHGFEDPCSKEDQGWFRKCNRYCPAHAETIDGASQKYFCTKRIWHAPVLPPEPGKVPFRTITKDGHEFPCKPHASGHHLVFVLDKSHSMSRGDCRPQLKELVQEQNNRLGCAAEAVIDFVKIRQEASWGLGDSDVASLIVFGEEAETLLEQKSLTEFEKGMRRTVPGLLHKDGTVKKTNFGAGLAAAHEVLRKASNAVTKPPVVVFLSDGKHNHPSPYGDSASALTTRYPTLKIHTVLLGKSEGGKQQLSDLAQAGRGQFKEVTDAKGLMDHFHYLADALRKKDRALLTGSVSRV